MLAQLKTPLTPPTTSLAPTLRRWYRIVYGNQHRPDLCAAQPGFTNTLYHFLPIIQLNIAFFITLLPFSPRIAQQTVKNVLNEVHHR